MTGCSHRTIAAIVINWNGWQDTVGCVRSLFALTGTPVHLVICDNGSTDGSVNRLTDWLKAEYGIGPRCHVESDVDSRVISFEGCSNDGLRTLQILRLPRNFGYAGAINRSIQWSRENLGAQDFWILNNDVKVASNALAELARVGYSAGVGLCGSVLFEWGDWSSVQAIGGRYVRALAVGRHLKALPQGGAAVSFGFDYPIGASLFVTHEFIETVGLMDEKYFLYYEEMDWAERGRGLGFLPAVALNSRVQHKEGASTGSQGGVRNKSMLSEYYGVVNRLRITRKFFPWLLPVVWLSLVLVVIDRVAHAEWRRASLVLRLMLRAGSVPRP